MKVRVIGNGKVIYFTLGQHMTPQEVKTYNDCCLLGLPFDPYTGMKDKNDVEIYQNDIVNFAKKESWCPNCQGEKLKYNVAQFCPSCGTKIEQIDFVTTSKIVMKNGGFCFEYDEDIVKGMSHRWQTHIAEIYICWKEVIGNIHQNTELLPLLQESK